MSTHKATEVLGLGSRARVYRDRERSILLVTIIGDGLGIGAGEVGNWSGATDLGLGRLIGVVLVVLVNFLVLVELFFVALVVAIADYRDGFGGSVNGLSLLGRGCLLC